MLYELIEHYLVMKNIQLKFDLELNWWRYSRLKIAKVCLDQSTLTLVMVVGISGLGFIFGDDQGQ